MPQTSYPGGKLTIGWEPGWTWNASGCLEQSKNAASVGNQTQTVGSFIPWRSHSIDWDISGLLRTVWLVVAARHVQTNAGYTIHVAARCLPSYERLILSPQLCACFVFQTREIFISAVGIVETKFIPFRSAVFLHDCELFLTLLQLSRDSL